jgi:hypothetical protein
MPEHGLLHARLHPLGKNDVADWLEIAKWVLIGISACVVLGTGVLSLLAWYLTHPD